MIDIKEFYEYTPPANCMQGRVVVITGAGDGIGKTAAFSCAAHGATVVLLGRTLSKLEAVYDSIEDAGYPKPAIFPVNFESAVAQDYQQLQAALQQEFGRVDGLLHNASELGSQTPLAHYNIAEWQKVMQVNLDTPLRLTQALLPLLQNSPDGRVLFTGSSVGVRGRAYWGAYAVSKGATETLMQVLADELENTAIRVNSINPGATRTAMRAKAYPAEDPTQVTTAESLMNRYLFLLGPAGAGWHGMQMDAQP